MTKTKQLLLLCTLLLWAVGVSAEDRDDAYSASDYWGNLEFGSIEQMPLATMSTAKATVKLYVEWSGNGTLTANGTALTNYGYTNDIPVIDSDVSLVATGDVQLTYLDCNDNQLTDLNVAACTMLKTLSCSKNELTELKVTACTDLTDLRCSNNQLTELNVTPCTELKSLSCSNNQLTELDVATCSKLLELLCYNNRLTELDVTACTKLTDLDCGFNQLTELNVTGCTDLEWFTCENNRLSALDVTAFAKLEMLSCYSNQLQTLAFDGCTNLQVLACSDNQLKSLDVSDLEQLMVLACNLNSLTSLAVNENLQMLCADNNQLSLENLYAISSKTGGYNDLSSIISKIAKFMEMMGYPEGASLMLSPQLSMEPKKVEVGEAFALPELLSINETGTGIEVFVGSEELPAPPSSYTIDAQNGTISFNEKGEYMVTFSNSAIVSDDENNTPVVTHFYQIVDKIETAIPDVSAETAIVVAYYTISGQRLMQEPESGTYIKLYSDGKAEKVMKY